MRSTLALTFFVGALALAPGLAAADETPRSLEQLAVEMAHTPADHAALASHYRAKAADARGEATRHKGMARAYTGGKANARAGMQSHCKKIAAKNASIAKEYEALAKLHEQEAKQPQ